MKELVIFVILLTRQTKESLRGERQFSVGEGSRLHFEFLQYSCIILNNYNQTFTFVGELNPVTFTLLLPRGNSAELQRRRTKLSWLFRFDLFATASAVMWTKSKVIFSGESFRSWDLAATKTQETLSELSQQRVACQRGR